VLDVLFSFAVRNSQCIVHTMHSLLIYQRRAPPRLSATHTSDTGATNLAPRHSQIVQCLKYLAYSF